MGHRLNPISWSHAVHEDYEVVAWVASARVVYGLGPPAMKPWPKGRWGAHAFSTGTTSAAVQGTGPWNDEHMVNHKPTLVNGIFMHPDLKPGGPVYPNKNQLCMDSTTVWGANAACNTLGKLQAWDAMATQHERQHEASLQECLGSQTTADVLTTMEAATGTKADVDDVLQREWNKLYPKFAVAAEGKLPGLTSPIIWEHRDNNRWTLQSLNVPAHGGKWGC